MRRRHGFALLATLLGLAFLAAAAAHLDRQAVLRVLRGARLWPWVPLGMIVYLLGHGVRGLRLRRLVRSEATLDTGTATRVVVVGYAMNNVFPARLGEVVRAWMLTEHSGLPMTQTLTVTLVERLLDALVLLALFGAAAALLPGTPAAGIGVPIAAGLLALGGFTLALGTLAPGPALAFASRTVHRFAPRAHDRAMSHAHAVLNALAPLRNARTALAVLASSLLVWTCETGLYLALLPASGLGIDPGRALFAMTGTNLGILVPSTPGYIGPFHYFCARSLVATGVDGPVAFGYAVLVHATFFVPITLWGVGVLVAHGLSIGRAMALGRDAEPMRAGPLRASGAAAAPAEPPASRFTRALTEAALPLDRDGLAGEAGAEVVNEVAGFVAGQIRELPVRLRALFAVGLGAFRTATRLRYLRGFCDLAPATRRAWFERWAYGSVPLARQLFRPVRSTALLAYYEHPAARAALDRPAAEEAR
jgi:uncharacterized protein (TIRG00374 family)